MKANTALSCLILTCALHQANAQSQTPFDRTRAEAATVKKALTEKRFALLDERLNTLQREYEQGRIGEDAVKDGYQAFGDLDAKQKEALQEWVNAFPKSYAAHLAFGRDLMISGLNARGEEFASATPEERFRRMRSLFQEARRELRLSISLTPQPLYSLQALMVMARSEGDRREARDVLEAANKACPQNHAVRVQYQISLAPRWGGSYEQMDTFIDESRKQGLDSNGIAELQGIELWYKGKDANSHHDEAGTRRYYEQALQIGDKVGGRFRQDYLLDAIGHLCNVTASVVYCGDPVLLDYFERQRTGR